MSQSALFLGSTGNLVGIMGKRHVLIPESLRGGIDGGGTEAVGARRGAQAGGGGPGGAPPAGPPPRPPPPPPAAPRCRACARAPRLGIAPQGLPFLRRRAIQGHRGLHERLERARGA